MFEKLISTLLESRTQAHIFHWQTTGPGSYALHIALQGYYDALPDMIDTLVETYQGKHGIISGYTSPATFSDFEKVSPIKNEPKTLTRNVPSGLSVNFLKY